MAFRSGFKKTQVWRKPKNVGLIKPKLVFGFPKKSTQLKPHFRPSFKTPKRYYTPGDILHEHSLHMAVERDNNTMKLEFSPMNNDMIIQSSKTKVFAKKVTINIEFTDDHTNMSSCKFERVLYDLPYPLIISYRSR